MDIHKWRIKKIVKSVFILFWIDTTNCTIKLVGAIEIEYENIEDRKWQYQKTKLGTKSEI
jgi:hypothetical protein